MPVGRNFCEQLFGLEEPGRVQLLGGPKVPGADPLTEKIIVPVEGVALELVSMTVAIHVEFWFTTIGVSHATTVLVG